MGIKWILNTQNCVKQKIVIVYYPKGCYKMVSETLNLSNSSPVMGFRASFDTQDWVNYGFLEPNNVSLTKDLWYISQQNE